MKARRYVIRYSNNGGWRGTSCWFVFDRFNERIVSEAYTKPGAMQVARSMNAGEPRTIAALLESA